MAPGRRGVRGRTTGGAVLSREEARDFLVGHHGLRAVEHPPGAAGVRALLARLRCIQLDPLDPLGTNADLVALARLDGVARGDVYAHAYPGHAFEHWAKERCLLPASAFPWYRDESAQSSWWRLGERYQRLAPGLLERVLEEVRARGPLSARELSDHGAVEPMDWHGWKSTAKAGSMALDVLWTRCDIVIAGRGPQGKLYDVPARALPRFARRARTHPHARDDFQRWALLERVEAAGLLSRASGPAWGALERARETGLADTLVAEGLLEEVTLEGSSRSYLAPAGFRARRFPKDDGRLRILGPLDPLLWDRQLVREVFGFDYVWEVYKPPAQRRFGWYVVPLLHQGRLVGRLDGAIDAGVLRVKNLWSEAGQRLDAGALRVALARHAAACGAGSVALPKRIRVA